jgi:hypothetical protein
MDTQQFNIFFLYWLEILTLGHIESVSLFLSFFFLGNLVFSQVDITL